MKPDTVCTDHPLAPHGFNRDRSLSEDRYVCDCEDWIPPEDTEHLVREALKNALEALEETGEYPITTDLVYSALWALNQPGKAFVDGGPRIPEQQNVKLVWATPDGEELLARIARVSNPDNENNSATAPKLIKYLREHQHWSPFEMVSVCMEIRTTRDIGRQILRHRSFSFQEFSGRYQTYDKLMEGLGERREPRLQDTKNRQNSIETNDLQLRSWWYQAQEAIYKDAKALYDTALAKGVAKEQARALLPEGLTPSRMYMAGTLRSWIHYCDIRCDAATQKEHRLIAQQCREILSQLFPSVFNGDAS